MINILEFFYPHFILDIFENIPILKEITKNILSPINSLVKLYSSQFWTLMRYCREMPSVPCGDVRNLWRWIDYLLCHLAIGWLVAWLVGWSYVFFASFWLRHSSLRTLSFQTFVNISLTFPTIFYSLLPWPVCLVEINTSHDAIHYPVCLCIKHEWRCRPGPPSQGKRPCYFRRASKG